MDNVASLSDDTHGRRGACQMSTCDVKKLKNIANRRIYIEQAIPVTLNQHLDYIMKSVAGKCNLYPPLIKYN